MAQDGSTLYYDRKKHFDFDRTYYYLKKIGMNLVNPDTQLITGIGGEGDFIETDTKKVTNCIYNQNSFGVDLWMEDKSNIFWSFADNENYFFQNFGFNYLPNYDLIEQKISPLFIKLALSELYIAKENLIGFTLDQFGNSDWNSFEEIFDPENNNILNHSYISEITFLQKEKINKIALDDKSKIISINKNFKCISRDEKLGAYLKSIL